MKKSIIKFTKTRDVQLPVRGHAHDAGIDFFVPKLDEKFKDELKSKNHYYLRFYESKGKHYFVLRPFARVNIPSGIHCQMEEPGRALIAANKSGVATKKGLIFGAQVVDYEYQGEIHISVINTSSKNAVIEEGQKLLQFLETPVFTSEIEEVDTLENLYPKGATSRADGGFGSTNKSETQI